jgi:type II secretory pathway pseudopilin PulG
MAALLVALSVLCIMVSVAIPVWSTVARREREEELIFRGRQYARAIELFQRRYAGTFPPHIDALLEGRFLRKRYLDPITGGDFQLLYAGIPAAASDKGSGAIPLATNGRRGIVGVVSRSHETSLRLYQGRSNYAEWLFVVGDSKTGRDSASH